MEFPESACGPWSHARSEGAMTGDLAGAPSPESVAGASSKGNLLREWMLGGQKGQMLHQKMPHLLCALVAALPDTPHVTTANKMPRPGDGIVPIHWVPFGLQGLTVPASARSSPSPL